MITMILSYPVSLIHSMIKNPQIKKILSIVFGVVILQFCFQEAYFLLLEVHGLVGSTL